MRICEIYINGNFNRIKQTRRQKDSTGDNIIFPPRLTKITFPDFQPRLQAAGMATRP
ncbi:MAG: hypothetical protein ACUVRA_05130 [Candidatus Bathyarchaeaceae archaeon]